MSCISGLWRWASPVMSAAPAGPLRSSSRPGETVTGASTGRGSRNPGCGCSSTGARALGLGFAGTNLFCAWLAWSRFRVILATWDRTMGTLVSCLDTTLRAVGGAPTYLLTDNEKTVTLERVAGVPVRQPEMVAVGRHYGCVLHTCVPYDPESKGGAESTVGVAKRDLVPTSADLLEQYGSFADLVETCAKVSAELKGRVHRETARAPVDMLAEEGPRLHVLPVEAHTSALGEPRAVGDDQTPVGLGSLLHPGRASGHAGLVPGRR